MNKKNSEYESKDCEQALRVVLTEKELLDLGRESADAIEGKSALEQDFEEVKAEFKAKIATKETIVARNSVLIRNGYEMRSVECEWRFYYSAGIKELWRKDTGEMVKKCRIESFERQRTIPEEEESETASRKKPCKANGAQAEAH